MLLHLKILCPLLLCLDKILALQAKRKPLSFRGMWLNSKLLWSSSPLVGQDVDPLNDEPFQQRDNWDDYVESCLPIEQFLQFNGDVNREFYVQDVNVVPPEMVDASIENDARVGCCVSAEEQYLVPSSLIERWGNAMGILFLSYLSILHLCGKLIFHSISYLL